MCYVFHNYYVKKKSRQARETTAIPSNIKNLRNVRAKENPYTQRTNIEFVNRHETSQSKVKTE